VYSRSADFKALEQSLSKSAFTLHVTPIARRETRGTLCQGVQFFGLFVGSSLKALRDTIRQVGRERPSTDLRLQKLPALVAPETALSLQLLMTKNLGKQTEAAQLNSAQAWMSIYGHRSSESSGRKIPGKRKRQRENNSQDCACILNADESGK